MKKTLTKNLPPSPLRISFTANQLKKNDYKAKILDLKGKKARSLEICSSNDKSLAFSQIQQKNQKNTETKETRIKNLILKREIYIAYLQRKKERQSLQMIEDKKNQLRTQEIENNKKIRHLFLQAYELTEKIKKLTAVRHEVTKIVKMLVNRRCKIYKKIKSVENLTFLKQVEYRIFVTKILNYRFNIERKIEKERILIPELIKAIYNSDVNSAKKILQSGIVFEEYKNNIEEDENLNSRNYGVKPQNFTQRKLSSMLYKKILHREVALMYELLANSVLKNNKSLLKILLVYGMNINANFEKNDSLLQVSIYKKNYPMAVYLLKNGADPDQRNNDGDNSLDLLYKVFDKENEEGEILKFAKIIIKTSIKKYFYQKNGESILNSVVALGRKNLRDLYSDFYRNECEEKERISWSPTTNSLSLCKLRSQSI